MSKILSFGEKHSKVSKDVIFKKVWDGFKSQDRFIRFYIIFAVLVVVATPVIISGYLIFTPHAATITSQVGTSWSSAPNSSLLQSTGSLVQPASAPPSYIVDQEIINELNILNNYRAQNGLSLLTSDKALTDIAKWMTNDMATNNYFSHTDSLGRGPSQRMDAFGYNYNTWKGENLGAGAGEAQIIFDAWRNSSGHNENMLNSNYTAVGIYRAYNSSSIYGWYWAEEFGGVIDQQVNYVTPAPVNNPPIGTHDTVDNATCNTRGWAFNPDNSSLSIDVHIYRDGPYGTGTIINMSTTNVLRTDVNNAYSISGNHGFDITFNSSSGLLDGRSHSLYVYAIDSAGGNNPLLGGTPKTIDCSNIDSDRDGFKDGVELYIGTDPKVKCGTNAWPPDFNNDGKITNSDVLSFSPSFNSREGDARYDRRHDLNVDRVVSLADVLKLNPYFNKSCTP